MGGARRSRRVRNPVHSREAFVGNGELFTESDGAIDRAIADSVRVSENPVGRAS
jgi:hypothetical protein